MLSLLLSIGIFLLITQKIDESNLLEKPASSGDVKIERAILFPYDVISLKRVLVIQRLPWSGLLHPVTLLSTHPQP